VSIVVFCDLDGVLTDFVRPALALHGKPLPMADVRRDFVDQVGIPANEFWAPLGRFFWENLPWTDEGVSFFNHLEGLVGAENLHLLTSPCLTDGCRDGKAAWVMKHLPSYERRLFIGAVKAAIAAPNKLLIDDNGPHVEAFRKAGGRAVLVPRPWNDRRGETDSEGRFDVTAVVREIRGVMTGVKEYEDEMYCENCRKDTRHFISESGHERDSSGDLFRCLECRWWATGLTGTYHPPLPNEGD
jgi:hypothetical protein